MCCTSFYRVLAITAALALLPWSPKASADEMLPFEARLEGFAVPVPQPDGTISNTEIAVGQATYLGLFSWMSEEEAKFTPQGTLHVTGSFTMTAANGDQVFGIYETTGTINWDLFTGRFIGCYEVKGGTGRFANATGKGTIIGDGNLLDPFEIVGSLSGTISQPNQ
jgi:hypothetical protein